MVLSTMRSLVTTFIISLGYGNGRKMFIQALRLFAALFKALELGLHSAPHASRALVQKFVETP